MLYQLIFLTVTSVIVSAHNQPFRAIVRLASPTGHDIHGNITLTQLEGRVQIQGTITGLPPGHYGFHVHETGDITGGCGSTGSHFNPEKKDHGHPNDVIRHVGDLGNVEFDSNNISNIDFEDKLIALSGPNNVLGRAIVLHERADDFGRTDHPDSRKTGNAGGRVACGVIGILSPVTGWGVNDATKTYVPYTVSLFVMTMSWLVK